MVRRGKQQARTPVTCFTYPQGDGSVLPQVCTLIATVATLVSFPIFSPDFLCLQLTVRGRSEAVCTGLYWNHRDFYEGSTNWAPNVRLAALGGALAVLCGILAFGFLTMACCQRLSVSRLRTVLALQTLAAMTTILSLSAGQTPACRLFEDDCQVHKVRIATGAGSMIAAYFLFVAAGFATYVFFLQVRLPRGRSSPIIQNKESIPAVVPQTIRTVFPDGTVYVERVFAEGGELVSELKVEKPESPSQPSDKKIPPDLSLFPPPIV